MQVSTSGGRAKSLLARVLHRAASFRRLARVSKALHVGVFRLSRGRVMGKWFGSPVLVLETVGRRTGKRRRTPVTYSPIGDGYVVVAINAGSRRVPAWWLNLRAAGKGTAWIRGERFDVRAREAHGEEAERLWQSYVEQAPVLEDFRDYAAREIPVVVLEREHQ